MSKAGSPSSLPNPGLVYEDDPEIRDNERLLRIVPASSIYCDSVTGKEKAHSKDFQDASKRRASEMGYPAVGMSVHLESVLRANSLTPQSLLDQWPHPARLVVLTAEDVRGEGQGVVAKPEPTRPAHALVFPKEGARKKSPVRDALAERAVVLATI